MSFPHPTHPAHSKSPRLRPQKPPVPPLSANTETGGSGGRSGVGRTLRWTSGRLFTELLGFGLRRFTLWSGASTFSPVRGEGKIGYGFPSSELQTPLSHTLKVRRGPFRECASRYCSETIPPPPTSPGLLSSQGVGSRTAPTHPGPAPPGPPLVRPSHSVDPTPRLGSINGKPVSLGRGKRNVNRARLTGTLVEPEGSRACVGPGPFRPGVTSQSFGLVRD